MFPFWDHIWNLIRHLQLLNDTTHTSRLKWNLLQPLFHRIYLKVTVIVLNGPITSTTSSQIAVLSWALAVPRRSPEAHCDAAFGAHASRLWNGTPVDVMVCAPLSTRAGKSSFLRRSLRSSEVVFVWTHECMSLLQIPTCFNPRLKPNSHWIKNVLIYSLTR